MHRVRIEKPLQQGFPPVCPGCGGVPRISHEVVYRKLNTMGCLAALIGHLHYTIYKLPIPVCTDCARSARLAPYIWILAGVSMTVLGFLLIALLKDSHIKGFPALAIFLMIPAGFFVAPLGYMISSEKGGPVKILAYGPSWENMEWIEIAVRSGKFAAVAKDSPLPPGVPAA